jgi:hypothetical protein
MIPARYARHAPAALVLTVLLAAPASSAAQSAPARLQVQPVPGPLAGGRVVIVENTEAGEVRARLNEVLANYSPSLGQVLKLDPSLLGNADYLAPYPALAQFLGQHPEVARDPGYFLAEVRMPSSASERSQEDRRQEYWRETLAGVMVFVGFLFLAGILIWLIKTLLDYRRWLRLSKIQAEAHNKLLDRFAANEELLGYVGSDAGRRFLASAPIALDAAEPASPAPVRRILWAVEAGCVLAAAGAGLLAISRMVEAVSQPMLALGVLAVALGVGFVLAAAVSYVLSRRLGLMTPAGSAERTPPAGV